MEYDVNKDFDFSILKDHDIIKFKCEQCGIDFSQAYYRFDKVFLCKKCKLTFNNLKKFGVTNIIQLTSTKANLKSVTQEKYDQDFLEHYED